MLCYRVTRKLLTFQQCNADRRKIIRISWINASCQPAELKKTGLSARFLIDYCACFAAAT
jgi:hypothetical protein